MRTPALIAITRFGLGPTPGLIEDVSADPRGYLEAQCEATDAARIEAPYLRDSRAMADFFIALNAPVRALRLKERRGEAFTDADRQAREAALMDRGREQRQVVFDEVAARFDHAVETGHPLLERLALFWANHFSVSATKNAQMKFLAGAFEREAIRPHVLGRFSDMLIASTTHPAMLHYLDNILSIGPNSRGGRRRNNAAVNENLAREVLELHTLGAGGGYSQGDVVALAETLSGWVGGFTLQPGNPVFRPEWHEPGARTVLGTHYPASGQDQLAEVLEDLAVHPSTAQHVARKMSSHFVGDEADPALVEALADTFLVTGGDLREVALTLVTHDAAWVAEPHKTVPPYDFMVGAVRSVGRPLLPSPFVVRSARELAQGVFGAPSPAGWPSQDGAFLGGDALLERVDFARQIARRFSDVRDVRSHARALFADALDPFVAEAVERAEDPSQAMVLLLMSPPFQRR